MSTHRQHQRQAAEARDDRACPACGHRLGAHRGLALVCGADGCRCARFVVNPDGRGWRVRDTKTGHLHSARIADRARAQRQADAMNARLAGEEGAR